MFENKKRDFGNVFFKQFGKPLQVGRPSNMPQAQPIIEMIMADAKKFNRIYVASIHLDLTENDIKSVFEAFGRVVSIDLPKNPFNNKHRRV